MLRECVCPNSMSVRMCYSYEFVRLRRPIAVMCLIIFALTSTSATFIDFGDKRRTHTLTQCVVLGFCATNVMTSE